MKASELMIGDWVEMNLSPSVLNSYFKAQIVVSNLVSLEANYDFDVRPIPLTEEILKANGRIYNGGFAKYLLNENLNVSYDFSSRRFVFGCNRIEKIKYVHELQHALRLCGLNELADNLKVE